MIRSLKKIKFLFLFLLTLSSTEIFSQWAIGNCSPPPLSGIESAASFGGSNVDITIDSFSKMFGGIIVNGSTMLYVDVKEVGAPGSCRWKLDMIIDNLLFADNAVWNPVATYSTSANYPKIYTLKVKISNVCGTPLNNDVWQNFVLDGNSLTVIRDFGVGCNLDPVVGCPADAGCMVADAPYQKQVNGDGNYLTFWDQFSFKVDYWIYFSPNNSYSQTDVLTELLSGYTPGIYNLNIKFKISEVAP